MDALRKLIRKRQQRIINERIDREFEDIFREYRMMEFNDNNKNFIRSRPVEQRDEIINYLTDNEKKKIRNNKTFTEMPEVEPYELENPNLLTDKIPHNLLHPDGGITDDFVFSFMANTSNGTKRSLAFRITIDNIEDIEDLILRCVSYCLETLRPGDDSDNFYTGLDETGRIVIQSTNVDDLQTTLINNFKYDYQFGQTVKVNKDCAIELLKVIKGEKAKLDKAIYGGMTVEQIGELYKINKVPLKIYNRIGGLLYQSQGIGGKKPNYTILRIVNNHVEMEKALHTGLFYKYYENIEEIKCIVDKALEMQIMPTDVKQSDNKISQIRIFDTFHIYDPMFSDRKILNVPDDKTTLNYGLTLLSDIDEAITSCYSNEIMKIMSLCNTTATVLDFGIKILDNNIPELIGYDINKCYRSILELGDFGKCLMFPVFNITDTVELYDTNKKTCGNVGFYYCEGYGWVIREFYKYFNITPTHMIISYGYVNNFAIWEKIKDLSVSKRLINSIIGTFNKTTKVKSQSYISVDATEAEYLKNQAILNGQTYAKVDINDSIMENEQLWITNITKIDRLNNKNKRPIYLSIVQFGKILIDKVYKSINGLCYEIRTDCVICDVNATIDMNCIKPYTLKLEMGKIPYARISKNDTNEIIKPKLDKIKTNYWIEPIDLNDNVEINGVFQGRYPVAYNFIDTNQSFLIEGKGGCGKSTMIESIKKYLKELNKSFATVCYKCSNSQTIQGETLHSFLKFAGDTQYNPDNIRDVDYLIVDEYTMVPFHFYNEIQTLINNKKIKNVILAGNYNQLPSLLPSKWVKLHNINNPDDQIVKLFKDPEEPFYTFEFIKEITDGNGIFLTRSYRVNSLTYQLIPIESIEEVMESPLDAMICMSNKEVAYWNEEFKKLYCKKMKIKNFNEKIITGCIYKTSRNVRYRCMGYDNKTKLFNLQRMDNFKDSEVDKLLKGVTKEFILNQMEISMAMTIYQSQGYEFNNYIIYKIDSLDHKNFEVAITRRKSSEIYIIG
jgi:hypothetical protein